MGFLALADPTDPQSWYAAVVGASGAVFGLFGALLVVNRRLGIENRGLFVFFAINAAIGFFPGANIAWQAHLGGLVTGLLTALALVHAPAARRSALQAAGLVVVLVVLVLVAVLKLSSV